MAALESAKMNTLSRTGYASYFPIPHRTPHSISVEDRLGRGDVFLFYCLTYKKEKKSGEEHEHEKLLSH